MQLNSLLFSQQFSVELQLYLLQHPRVGVVKDITEVQQRTAEKIGDYLIAKGINFAGIDMIGKYLTEINITSPTCAREIFKQSGKNPIKEYLEIL